MFITNFSTKINTCQPSKIIMHVWIIKLRFVRKLSWLMIMGKKRCLYVLPKLIEGVRNLILESRSYSWGFLIFQRDDISARFYHIKMQLKAKPWITLDVGKEYICICIYICACVWVCICTVGIFLKNRQDRYRILGSRITNIAWSGTHGVFMSKLVRFCNLSLSLSHLSSSLSSLSHLSPLSSPLSLSLSLSLLSSSLSPLSLSLSLSLSSLSLISLSLSLSLSLSHTHTHIHTHTHTHTHTRAGRSNNKFNYIKSELMQTQ